jgi:membrane protein required for beta-lactamase induction
MKPKNVWNALGYWGKRIALVAAVVGPLVAAMRWFNARAESRVMQKQALDKVPKLEASVEECNDRDDSLGAELERVKVSICTLGYEMRAGFKALLGERTYKAAIRRESGDR